MRIGFETPVDACGRGFGRARGNDANQRRPCPYRPAVWGARRYEGRPRTTLWCRMHRVPSAGLVYSIGPWVHIPVLAGRLRG